MVLLLQGDAKNSLEDFFQCLSCAIPTSKEHRRGSQVKQDESVADGLCCGVDRPVPAPKGVLPKPYRTCSHMALESHTPTQMFSLCIEARSPIDAGTDY